MSRVVARFASPLCGKLDTVCSIVARGGDVALRPGQAHRFAERCDCHLGFAYQHIGVVTRLTALFDELPRRVARLVRLLSHDWQDVTARIEMATQALTQVCSAARAQMHEAPEDVHFELFSSETAAAWRTRSDRMMPAVPEEQHALFEPQPTRLSAINVGDPAAARVLDGVVKRDQSSASSAPQVGHGSTR
jgi:hypothetical protein